MKEIYEKMKERLVELNEVDCCDNFASSGCDGCDYTCDDNCSAACETSCNGGCERGNTWL